MIAGSFDVNPDFVRNLRESTTRPEWNEFFETLRKGLQGRILSTPDQELPKLKHQLEFVGELENTFKEIRP